eukprot:gene6990-4954_t
MYIFNSSVSHCLWVVRQRESMEQRLGLPSCPSRLSSHIPQVERVVLMTYLSVCSFVYLFVSNREKKFVTNVNNLMVKCFRIYVRVCVSVYVTLTLHRLILPSFIKETDTTASGFLYHFKETTTKKKERERDRESGPSSI